MSSEPGESATDIAVIRQVLAGEVDAFARLIDRYQGAVFAIAGRHVPKEHVAETAQDTFVEAFRSLKNYTPQGGFDRWLARIAVRCCHDYWRARYRKRELSLSRIESEGRELAGEASPLAGKADRHENHDLRNLLDTYLARLSPDDRMVLTLVYFDGYSIREAADTLDWSPSKVKVRAHRARKELRVHLEKLLEAKGACHG